MYQLIANTLNLNVVNVTAVVKLLADGATIPFIARYRKEMTGGLDEVEIEKIGNERTKLIELEKRKETIFDRLKELSITDQKLLDKIKNCFDPKKVEDLYLPYKPKRKTKATMARERGLEPLAELIAAQKEKNLYQTALRFRNPELSTEDALQGARDIIAEWISEDEYTRDQLRRQYQRTAELVSTVVKSKKEAAIKYKDYFEFNQSINRMPSHRVLAIFRAEKEGLLRVKIRIDTEEAINKINHNFIESNGESADQIKMAVEDSYKRLLAPSIETEMRNDAKEKADAEAIETFTKNLSQLLLAAPLGAKRVLALDPGFRSGCKVVCLDEQGHFLTNTTIYPHPPQKRHDEAENLLLNLVHKYKIQAIAIGNGTAGRETERFVKQALLSDSDIEVYLISEAGASIYSASENGRVEFPDLDLTVRGAISIGRRLLDPLSELVKIDAKSIGVGQYQHDVAQDKLKASLDNTVSFAVNKVGVNLNTASEHILQYVSGIGQKTAKNIIEHRQDQGPFKTKKSLLKIKGLGARTFEQAAGFVRIPNSKNPLDASAVHPESYSVVDKIARYAKLDIKSLIGNKEVLKQIPLPQFVDDKIGLPTLRDIISELQKPGQDPRGAAEAMNFDERLKDIADVHVGMTINGKITNLTKFGAFVDIGIKENGLIHKSQIANRFIEDPADVLSIDQAVVVKVIDLDLDRKRIQLSMRL